MSKNFLIDVHYNLYNSKMYYIVSNIHGSVMFSEDEVDLLIESFKDIKDLHEDWKPSVKKFKNAVKKVKNGQRNP